MTNVNLVGGPAWLPFSDLGAEAREEFRSVVRGYGIDTDGTWKCLWCGGTYELNDLMVGVAGDIKGSPVCIKHHRGGWAQFVETDPPSFDLNGD